MKKILTILSITSFLSFQKVFAATPENVIRGHSLILKFFGSMFGVLISALVIWLGLKIYKKLAIKDNAKLDNFDYEKNLDSPKDFKEAINLFLDKTDK